MLKKAHLLRWRPRPHAQRTESTPRVRPSGAASHLDLFEHPAKRSKGASMVSSEPPPEPGCAGKPALEQRLLRHAPSWVAILATVLIAAVGGDWVTARARDDAAEQVV